MADQGDSGRLVIYLDEEGRPTGKGYYQNWASLVHNDFEKTSDYAVTWKTGMPSWDVVRSVHNCLGIPVIDA